jgi:hypothetical protein
LLGGSSQSCPASDKAISQIRAAASDRSLCVQIFYSVQRAGALGPQAVARTAYLQGLHPDPDPLTAPGLNVWIGGGGGVATAHVDV